MGTEISRFVKYGPPSPYVAKVSHGSGHGAVAGTRGGDFNTCGLAEGGDDSGWPVVSGLAVIA